MAACTSAPTVGSRFQIMRCAVRMHSWVDQARWNQLSDADKARYAPLCPDFLVEILSESDSRSQLQEKMEMWIANGAKLAWMMDPFAADLTIYEPGQAPRRTIRPHWVEAETVVTGFRLDISRLWQRQVRPDSCVKLPMFSPAQVRGWKAQSGALPNGTGRLAL